MERRLAAILVADIVGYSAQMERDEAGTYARVTARRREIFEPEIARHQGRIFKLTGDGLLAEFSSAVQAVECAMALQTALAERNRDVGPDQVILARIGINLGEVIVDGEDRLGEGVNIAARLEQLADPGGICVSEKVAREVERKLAFGFESMGQRMVKNISEPIHVYRVSADVTKGPRRAAAGGPRRRWAIGAVATLGLMAIVGGGLYAARGPVAVPAGVAAVVAMQSDSLPVLWVYPFVTAADVPDADKLGEQIAREITDALATSTDLAAVAGISPTDTGDASQPTPAADYILTGRITREGDMFGLHVELADASGQNMLWTGNRVFTEAEFADERGSFAGRVYASLLGSRGEILRVEEAQTWQKVPEELTEYDFHLRGAVRLIGGTDIDRIEGRAYWRDGLERFPDSALLRLDLAEGQYRDAVRNPKIAAQGISSAWHLLGQAEARLDRQPEHLARAANWRLPYLRAILLPLALGDFDKAVQQAQQARAMMPRDPQVAADLAQVLANAGSVQTAIDWARFAIDRQYNPPDDFHAVLGWALYLANRPQEAVAAFQRMRDPVSAEHAAALVAMGRRAEGEAMIAALQARNPDAVSADVLLFGTGGRVHRTATNSQLEVDLAGVMDGQGKRFGPNGPRMLKRDLDGPAMKRAPDASFD